MRSMGCKLVNCDCRQPGFPRHTHSHPLDEHGQRVCLGMVPHEPPFPPAKGRGPDRPFRHWSMVWLIVGLALLALKVWLEYHQKVEIELP